MSGVTQPRGRPWIVRWVPSTTKPVASPTKKSRHEVEALREKKSRQEWIISMALGRGDQRRKIYFVKKWAGFVKVAR